MSDRIERYVRLERGLLTHRLRVLLSGATLQPDDAEEDRIERESEILWRAMDADERRRLDGAADRPSSAWIAPPAANSPLGTGFTVWTRALADVVEISLPPATRSRVPDGAAARGARLVVDWNELTGTPRATAAVLTDAALVLLRRSIDEVCEGGGLSLVDPDTGDILLSVAPQPSGVAERPDDRSGT